MTDDNIPVEPARERGWKQTIRQPKIWIPAAGVALVAVVGGAIAATAGGGDSVAGPSGTASPGPTVEAAGPSTTITPSPTTSASVPPSATPSASPSWGDDEGFEAEPAACVPNGTIVAAPKQSQSFVEPEPGSQAATYDGDGLTSFQTLGFSADDSRIALHAYNEGSEWISIRRPSDLKEVAVYRSQYEAAVAWDNGHTKLAVATTDADDRLTVSVVNPSSGTASIVYSADETTAQSVAWSPDGKCLVLAARWSGNLWNDDDPYIHAMTIIDTATGNSSYLGNGISAVYSPSGDSIFFFGVDFMTDRIKLFQADAATGAAVARSIGEGSTTDDVGHLPVNFSPDGAVGVYVEHPEQASANIKNIEGGGDGDGYLAKFPDAVASMPVWNPDSRRVAYCTGWFETGCDTVVIADGYGGSVSVEADTPEGWISSIRWTPDGESLVAGANTGKESAIYRFESGSWTRITDISAGYASGPMVWSHDGSTVVWSLEHSLFVAHN